MKNIENIALMLEKVDELPMLPSVAYKILTSAFTEESSANDFAKEIMLDQSLAAKVLKTANSAYYGQSGRIKTIKDSVVVLGFRVIKKIVLTISILNTFSKFKINRYFNPERFWIHCVGCAVGARLIGERTGLEIPEEAYVTGLLHDIGKIVLYSHFQDEFQRVTSLVCEKFLTIKQAEEEVLGMNHAVVGKLLLEKWNIPPGIVEAVCHHHDPQVELFTVGSGYLLARTVNLSDTLAHILNIGFGGDENPRILEPGQLEEINLNQQDLHDVALKMEDETYETVRSTGFSKSIKKESIFDLLIKTQNRLQQIYSESERDKNGTNNEGNTEQYSIFEEIFNQSAIGLFVINDEKKIIRFNQEASRIFGYSTDEILGKEVTTLIPERYKNFHHRTFGAVMGSGENRSRCFEFVAVRKDGREFPIELTFSLVKNPQQPYMIISARDVSDRKNVESEMKEKTDVLQEYLRLQNQWLIKTEQKYNSLFEAAETGILYLDEKGAIIELNKVAEEILGRDKTLILNKSILAIMPEQQNKKNAAIIKKIFSDVRKYKTEKLMEGSIVKSDGKEIPVEISFREIENASDKQMVCMVKDISKIKQIESQLISSQKLESFSVLTGGMLHNFKNMMASIIGYASLVKRLVPEHEKLNRYLDTIETSCTKAENLAREALTFGRRQDAGKKIVSVNEIIERTVLLFTECTDKSHAVKKNLDLTIQPAELNESQIEQVLLNLLFNARDAMPDGGEIVIETQNIYLSQEICLDYQNVTGGGFIEVVVKDNGVGMSEDVQKKIFKPFFTTKVEGKGTGLGLSTVERIVKNHRGFVQVFTSEGEGSTFKIFLPAIEKSDREIKKKNNTDLHYMKRGSETILAVDDENEVVRMISDAMSALGYNVMTAMDGREAVKLFNEHRSKIDLIILDLVMPSMDGYDTYKEIKTIDPLANIILCTGYASDENVQHMLRDGVKGLLKKPYRIEDLSRAVRLVLDEHQQQPVYMQQ